MAGQRTTTRNLARTGLVAVVLMSTGSGAAAAATTNGLLCPDSAVETTLEVPVSATDLATSEFATAAATTILDIEETADNGRDDGVLQPRINVALDGVRTDSDIADADDGSSRLPDEGVEGYGEARVPGVADDAMGRFKDRMFRRDI